MFKKNIVIYGATGSIGDSSINIIRNNKDKFNVVGLTCNTNIDKLLKIANEFNCINIGIAQENLIKNHKDKLSNFNVIKGIEQFYELIENLNVDIIIFAISGTAPLKLLMDLAGSGKTIGLVNKECVICLGNLFLNKAKKFLTKIIPLDSEHNAIYQLIKNKNINAIKRYTITASGGNFYNYSYSDLKKITPEQAITHPKWTMGNKITVDSSTLMNKGLEIIEACILFDINVNNIDALIHPQSIVHGIIEFKDNSSHAFLSQPNMEISISSIFFEDNDTEIDQFNLNLAKICSLDFYEIDVKKFKAIMLSKKAMEYSGLSPTVLNYANEKMVSLFLNKKIMFTDIVNNNEIIMDFFIRENNNISNPSIKDIYESFKIIDSFINKDGSLNIN